MKLSKALKNLMTEFDVVYGSDEFLPCPVDRLVRSGEAKILSSSGHGITFSYGGARLCQVYEDQSLEIWTGQEWVVLACA